MNTEETKKENVVKRALGNHYHAKVMGVQEKLQQKLHDDKPNQLVKQLGRIIDAEQSRLSMMAKD